MSLKIGQVIHVNARLTAAELFDNEAITRKLHLFSEPMQRALECSMVLNETAGPRGVEEPDVFPRCIDCFTEF